MKTRLPLGLIVIAIFQFLAAALLPPAVLLSIGPVLWVLIVAVFGVLGFYLLHRRAWSRLATIFVQGFSIIVRLLVGVSHAVAGGQVDYALLITFVISIALSALILYYVDLPDVQMLMQ
jgi:hypothetical protein